MAIDSHGYLLGGSSNLTGSSHLIIYTVNGLYQSYMFDLWQSMVITHLLTIFDIGTACRMLADR